MRCHSTHTHNLIAYSVFEFNFNGRFKRSLFIKSNMVHSKCDRRLCPCWSHLFAFFLSRFFFFEMYAQCSVNINIVTHIQSWILFLCTFGIPMKFIKIFIAVKYLPCNVYDICMPWAVSVRPRFYPNQYAPLIQSVWPLTRSIPVKYHINPIFCCLFRGRSTYSERWAQPQNPH